MLSASEDRLPPRQWRLHRPESPRGRGSTLHHRTRAASGGALEMMERIRGGGEDPNLSSVTERPLLDDDDDDIEGYITN